MKTFRFAFLTIVALPASAQVTAPTSAPPLAAKLETVMNTAKGAGFTGVVRVEKDGRVLLEKGYGFSNRERKIPFSPNTVVQIGSNTKDFTAVAILQLHERGVLSIQDPLGKFFRGAPADKRDITLAQLLSHRSGLPQDVGPDFEAIDRPTLIDRALNAKLLFAPGSRQSYSNAGFSVLAAIIENVSGKSYDVFIRDNILTPLGLTHTGYLLPKFAAVDEAHGYRADGTDYGTMLSKPHAADGPFWNLRGNGGMLSTVDDMHAFYKTLFESNRLLKPETRALRFHPNKPIGLAGSDNISFFLYERDPRARTEMIIASTSASVKAPMIRRQLGAALGIHSDDEGPPAAAVGAQLKPVPAAIGNIIREFFGVLNRGDVTALKSFVAAHFANDPGAPPIDQRVTRIAQIHVNQGAITVARMVAGDAGPVEVGITSALNGAATVRIIIDRASPYRIHGMMLLAGRD